ncbi:MAG: DEAD/DEAH box helicase family protein [Prevotella sp.]|jgi:type III restriction enzyme|nr:DEAD/DEAH box helicase family protein [Prevotella sp.]
MKILDYQQKAIQDLVKKTLILLENPNFEQNLILKAPTGSGKTFIATQYLADLTEELHTRPNCTYNEVAYVWIAPQKLHLQSFKKLKEVFAENHKLIPILFDDIDQTEGYIKSNEILFVNWESVNKDSNLMVQERENADSFFDIIKRTQYEQGRPIILIIDEEHRNWSKNADKSLQVVKRIHPKIELRISATPKTQSFNVVNIERSEVIKEEMIKKGICLNEDINVDENNESLNHLLLQKAMNMRTRIAQEYQRLDVKINPLLLIQLPNDTTESLSSEERTLAESIERMLKVEYDVCEENGRLGIWLSSKKTIGEEISRNDDITQVLLFKQAIALGWDCPRAAVLLIFRNIKSEEFTVQTLGRILRMPEQKFYPSEILNVGHVYTDISRNSIKIASDDMSYISKETILSIRRKNLNNIILPSYYSARKLEDRNYLGVKFKSTLLDEFANMLDLKATNTLFSISEMENWDESENKDEFGLLGTTVKFNRKHAMELGINLNVKSINVSIPRNLFFQNDEGEVVSSQHVKFARSMGEIYRVYMAFCRKLIIEGGFEPKRSTEKLAAYLKEIMEELFDIYEDDVPKIILSNDSKHHNRPKFENLISKALENYAHNRQDRLKKARMRDFRKTMWTVPEERYYQNDTHHEVTEVQNHALMPFVESNEASFPEQQFRDFLERNTQYIDWWYKNGDNGLSNYAIPYINNKQQKALFYVDFIIRMKVGKVFLFDTKSENSDSNAPAKHNALLNYINEQNKKKKDLDGGIIIGHEDLWRYSKFAITETNNVISWKAFCPDQYKPI